MVIQACRHHKPNSMISPSFKAPVIPSFKDIELSLPFQPGKNSNSKLTTKKAATKKPLTTDELNTRRKVKYAIGCLAGVSLVMGAKRLLRRLPFLGPILAPVLYIIPTVASGIILGSAVVYGLEEGDLAAGPRRVRQEAKRIGRELEATVGDVHSDIRRISRRHEEEVARLASSIEDTISSDVAPSIERAGRRLVRQMESNMMDLQDEIARGARKLEQSFRG